VRVRKRRLRLDLGAARLEIADVANPGRPLLRSFCVDGYELDGRARRGRGAARSEGHAAALGYPELIQALVLLDGRWRSRVIGRQSSSLSCRASRVGLLAFGGGNSANPAARGRRSCPGG
jgi:hypothetical protein